MEQPCEFCDTTESLDYKLVTISRQRAGKWYIFDHVPALVCPNCGHRYFDAEAVEAMERGMTDAPSNARPIEAWAITLSAPKE